MNTQMGESKRSIHNVIVRDLMGTELVAHVNSNKLNGYVVSDKLLGRGVDGSVYEVYKPPSKVIYAGKFGYGFNEESFAILMCQLGVGPQVYYVKLLDPSDVTYSFVNPDDEKNGMEGVEDGLLVIIMEKMDFNLGHLFENKHYHNWLLDNKKLLIDQLADILHILEKNKIFHSDFKKTNIMININVPKLRLIDFYEDGLNYDETEALSKMYNSYMEEFISWFDSIEV